ncbi:MAG: hypothetical protein IPJ82_21950 [Lewinellaceae bacterium]|nr:hypothetical protein [Lewinellaceae bacterium]
MSKSIIKPLTKDMSKIIVSLIVALLLSANAGAQCGWFRTFDAANEAEVPYKIIDFENNYFVLLSATSNFPPTTRNAILKFDDQGDYLWRAAATYPIESWADVLFYFPKDFVIAKDSSMYFFSNSQSWDMEGVFLINKFDKNGNLLWYKTYGVSGKNFYSGFRGLCLASDSLGLVMTGNTESGDGDYIIYQIDSSGEIIWDHVTDVPVFGYVGNTTPTVRMPDNSYKTAYDNRVLLDYRDY